MTSWTMAWSNEPPRRTGRGVGRGLTRLWTVVALAGFLAGAATGQEREPEADARPTFRAGIDLVTVRVTVKDGRGRPVTNLRAEDFTVLDRGEPRSLVGFDREAGPVGLALLFDVSGSMDLASRLHQARESAFFLLSSLRSGKDEAAVYAFDSTLHLVQPFTSDLDSLRARFTSIHPWGLTSLHDAIASAAVVIAPAGHQRRALVVLTDGLDTGSRLTPAEVSRTASAIDVPVYVMVVSNQIDAREHRRAARAHDAPQEGRLVDLANWTGGQLFVTTSPSESSLAARRIVDELRHQYLLAFEPSGDPGWRPLEVRVNRRDYVVRARGGYVAGQPRPVS